MFTKKLTYFLVAMSALSASAQTEEPVTLYGVKTYDTNQSYSGLYSVEAVENAQPQAYWQNGDMFGNGGAVYDNDKLYVLSYMNFGSMIWWYMECDVENKEYTFTQPQDFGIADAGSAQIYDPSTGTVYSVCLNADDPSQFTLSIMNIATGAKKPVAPLPQQLVAMSCTADGTLYGIGVDGNLYTVSKTDASLTLVGATGVKPSRSNQSAIIHYKTNVMYWSAYTADGGALYTVDISTGQATLLSKYEASFQLVGLFIKQTTRQPGSPEIATDITAAFDKASLNGTVSFTAPTTNAEGGELTGELSYEVRFNDEILATGTTQPGARVDAPVTSPSGGNCTFSVIVSNSFGGSRPRTVSLWVGMDSPLKVKDCTLVNDNGTLTLTWTLPETGVHGGYVDASQTRYIIDRGPYDTNVTNEFNGTMYTEEFKQAGVNPVMFRVTPVLNGITAEPAISNTVVVGDYMTPPFTEDFSDPFRSLVFTITDSYDPDDSAGWMYDLDRGLMKCEWPLADEHDAWLISAPVRFEAGKYYKVKVNMRSEGKHNFDTKEYDDVYAGNMALYLGSEPAAESMTTTLIAPFELTKKDFTSYDTDNFTVAETGVYHIGLHQSGQRSIYIPFLSKIEVEMGESGVNSAEMSAGVSVSVAGSSLLVSNPAGTAVKVVSADGRVVASTSESEASISLAQGIYIVSAPGFTTKIAVK